MARPYLADKRVSVNIMHDKESEKQSRLHWVEAPDGIFDVYANLVHLTWSLDDVRIRLAQLVTGSESRDPGDKYAGVAEERAAVTLSWRNAKLLRDQLTGVLDRYEKLNGTIKTDVKLAPSD